MVMPEWNADVPGRQSCFQYVFLLGMPRVKGIAHQSCTNPQSLQLHAISWACCCMPTSHAQHSSLLPGHAICCTPVKCLPSSNWLDGLPSFVRGHCAGFLCRVIALRPLIAELARCSSAEPLWMPPTHCRLTHYSCSPPECPRLRLLLGGCNCNVGVHGANQKGHSRHPRSDHQHAENMCD